MKILVTGAGGFLGRHVVAGLLARGHKVRAMVRPHSRRPAWPREIEIVPMDLRAPKDLDRALTGIDAIVHLAAATSGDEDAQFAATIVGSEHLLSAMNRVAVGRLVLVSSLVVYDWANVRGTMDESAPLNDDFYDMGAYHIAKSWQERLFRRAAVGAAWDLTILRPGFIWGRDHTAIAGMGRKWGPFYALIGPLTRLPLTHVENCADAIVAATEDPAAASNSFNIVDDDSVRVWRYARAHARGHGQRFVPLPIPYWLAMANAKLASWTSRKLFGPEARLPSLLTPRRFQAQFKPLRFDNGKLRRTLNWTPPLDHQARIDRSYGGADPA